MGVAVDAVVDSVAVNQPSSRAAEVVTLASSRPMTSSGSSLEGGTPSQTSLTTISDSRAWVALANSKDSSSNQG